MEHECVITNSGFRSLGGFFLFQVSYILNGNNNSIHFI